MAETLTKGEITRQKITKAAFVLFTEQGFHGTSMRQISEKAEITLGGIYNHFNGKDEIFEAVLFTYHPANVIMPILQEIDEPSIEGTVRRAARMGFDLFKEQDGILNLFYVELIEFKAKHATNIFQKLFPQALEFVKVLEKKEGKLRDIPTHIRLVSYLGMFFSYFLFNQFINRFKIFNAPRLDIDSMVDIYLYGIMEEPKQGQESR